MAKWTSALRVTNFSPKAIIMMFMLHLNKAMIKGLCYGSQRKSENLHKLSLKCESDDNGSANVVQTSCSFKAGWVYQRTLLSRADID